MRSLYSIKPWFVRKLRRVEDALVARRVSADAITYAGLAAALAAGAAIAVGGLLGVTLVWLAVPPLVLIRLACNALDGAVARRTGTTRPFGAALNEMCDRAADAAVIAPTAFVVRPGLALGATAAAFAASCTGVLAQAVTGRREMCGPMGKADRMAAIGIAAVAALFWGRAWVVADIAIVLGGILTVAARIDRIKARLEPTGAETDASRVVGFYGQRPDVHLVEVRAAAPFEEEMTGALGR